MIRIPAERGLRKPLREGIIHVPLTEPVASVGDIIQLEDTDRGQLFKAHVVAVDEGRRRIWFLERTEMDDRCCRA